MLIKKDIYDEDGVLLLAKGHIVDENSSAMIRLKYLGLFDLLEEDEDENDKSNDNNDINDNYPNQIITQVPEYSGNLEDTKNVLKPFEMKFTNFNDRIFAEAVKITDSIIHDCRDKLWYSHFRALLHYTSWTYSHSINTALISCVIGIGMRFARAELMELTTGAILHDIGMMLIPKTILLKQGPLTETERMLINGHCELGEAMVQESGLNQRIRNIILQHHEYLDGSGYPHALVSEDISRYAKIVSVACSLDSATSRRPYKAIKTTGQVLQEMELETHKYENQYIQVLKKFFDE